MLNGIPSNKMLFHGLVFIGYLIFSLYLQFKLSIIYISWLVITVIFIKAIKQIGPKFKYSTVLNRQICNVISY